MGVTTKLKADDFYSAIRGIDIVYFATRKIDYEKLVRILIDQRLIPENFDAEDFFDNEIVKAQKIRTKETHVRIAFEKAGIELEDGALNKVVKDIVDRLG